MTHPLRGYSCSKCGSRDVVLIAPGDDGVHELFLMRRPVPVTALCMNCWPIMMPVMVVEEGPKSEPADSPVVDQFIKHVETSPISRKDRGLLRRALDGTEPAPKSKTERAWERIAGS